MKKQEAFEALQFLADVATKMTGASVGEIRRFDKAIVFLDQYIKACEEPLNPEPPKPLKFNGKKSPKPVQQSGAI